MSRRHVRGGLHSLQVRFLLSQFQFVVGIELLFHHHQMSQFHVLLPRFLVSAMAPWRSFNTKKMDSKPIDLLWVAGIGQYGRSVAEVDDHWVVAE